MNINLRAVEPSDVDFLMQWENDPELWIYSDTIAPLSRKILLEYANNYDADVFKAGQLRLMVTNDDSTVGIADLYNVEPLHSRAMVAIFISPQHRKKGIATSAINQLATLASRHLCLHHLFAEIETSNFPSLMLFEKCGFHIIASMPEWRRTSFGFVDVNIVRKIL